MKATAYLRTSSATNVDGDSPYRQNDAISAFARSSGLQLTSCFWDAAVSGADPVETRSGFRSLMEHCEAEGVGVIVVEDPSRFARSMIAQEMGLALLAARGVRVVTASGQDLSDESDPAKVMMRQIAGAFSQYEKAKLVAKLAAGRDRKRRETGRCGGNAGWANRNPVLQKEAKRLARRSPTTGRRRSLREIAQALADLGFVSSRGSPLSPSVVRSLLLSPA